ncbi:MAG: cytochrome-c oxidase, cbb3-type subunit III [Rhodoferax sp.]|uniref:cytochrome-c oxidase, cbb3-type subunit III n=1 Tax=Rhodoferax sp. TaxID=50421 RepID=UPI003264A5D7
MSDFTSNFWSVFISAVSVVSIAACLLLLWITARKKVPFQSDNSTGHVWDGDLREMNNPLPRWWVGLFILTVLFGVGYLVAYPGLGSYAGKLGWTSQGEYNAEVAQANRELAPLYAQFTALPPEKLAGNAQAMAVGERLFMNNCAQCHGSDARGSKGFPNLTDGDWLHGGTPDKILETITHGRIGVMPPMAAAVGTPEDVKNVANYVLSLSGSPNDSLRAALGKSKFSVCAACHGVGGKGNQAIGAPNLSDDIWLHGWGEAAIIAMVNNGKTNQMPAQHDKLTEAQIHVLASYVWGLSNKPTP